MYGVDTIPARANKAAGETWRQTCIHGPSPWSARKCAVHRAAGKTMDRFLARQPILTADRRIFGYEILSRSGPENYCKPLADGEMYADTMDKLFLMGLNQMTHGLPAFLNCSREFLLRGYLELLPHESVVGEILETVKPELDVVSACRRMKEKGYRMALDDYQDSPEMEPFFGVTDFVKVDFLATSLNEQARLGEKFQQLKIPLIAEKVETLEQVERGKAMGYELFQGYFFCRPQMVEKRVVPANKLVYLRLIETLARPNFNMNTVVNLLKQEMSLSYRLMRYLNSPAFAMRVEVHSIPHALQLMGETATRKWLSLVCLSSLGGNHSFETIKVALVRARFSELLAEKMGMRKDAEDLFLVGLLSVIDALLGVSMREVLATLPLSKDVANALAGHSRPSRFRPIFDVVLDYESGTWEQLMDSAMALRLNETLIPDIYLQSVTWVDNIFLPLNGTLSA
jgi:c-di-GMP-related signal transduction protein